MKITIVTHRNANLSGAIIREDVRREHASREHASREHCSRENGVAPPTRCCCIWAAAFGGRSNASKQLQRYVTPLDYYIIQLVCYYKVIRPLSV